MKPLERLAALHRSFCSIFDTLRSPFLLAVRLYWGWQFIQTGLGKRYKYYEAYGAEESEPKKAGKAGSAA